jgi:formate--tetrahydrofolate ligase
MLQACSSSRAGRPSGKDAACESEGVRAVVSEHWPKGGEGALELADAVQEACDDRTDFRFLYALSKPLRDRVELVASEVYGADGVDRAPEAASKLRMYQEDPVTAGYGLCMVKTHLSLSGDPVWRACPRGSGCS